MPQNTTNGIKTSETAAAIVASVPTTEEALGITGGAPNIIVYRTVAEVLCSLNPGQVLPGTDIIFVNAWAPVNRSGQKLDKPIAIFGASVNLPAIRQTFENNVHSISILSNWYGFDGWQFDPKRYCTSSYEVGLHKAYRDGSAFGKWTIPELPVLNGNDRRGKVVCLRANMLALSRDRKSAFYNSFAVTHGLFDPYYQSCTELRTLESVYVNTVGFPSGQACCDPIDDPVFRSRIRPVVALPLNQLIR